MTSLMHKTTVLDWTEDFSQENGNYQNQCCKCNELFFGHKRRVVCKKCATKPQYEISDEEIKKLADDYLQKVGYVDNPTLIRNDFIEGAKAIQSLTRKSDSDAVAFQKWLFKNRYFDTDANGNHTQTSLHGSVGDSVIKTTEELYAQFKNTKWEQ